MTNEALRDAGSGRRTLAQAFDPSHNALNLFRLLMATSVIFWHSWPLTGRGIQTHWISQLFGASGVDGFFIVSGFLITRSWMRRSDSKLFLRARALRILPGFYIALSVTAFIAAPLGVALQGGDGWKLLTSTGPISFVVHDLGLYMFRRDIAGTPFHVPYPHAWNGSLWTLQWEAFCYLGILLLGVFGTLKTRWGIPVVAGIIWAWYLTVGHRLPHDGSLMSHVLDGSQLGLLFISGSLIYYISPKVRASWTLVAVATALFVASCFLHDYLMIGTWPFAYALITAGSLLNQHRLTIKNDLSYGTYVYAFAVQQVLACAGLATLAVGLFGLVSLACTLPLAAASWWLIEKPSLRHKIPKHARLAREPGVAAEFIQPSRLA
jgi:peptidoglycan/LPS O-acetylase OafA/YrhL